MRAGESDEELRDYIVRTMQGKEARHHIGEPGFLEAVPLHGPHRRLDQLVVTCWPVAISSDQSLTMSPWYGKASRQIAQLALPGRGLSLSTRIPQPGVVSDVRQPLHSFGVTGTTKTTKSGNLIASTTRWFDGCAITYDRFDLDMILRTIHRPTGTSLSRPELLTRLDA